MKEFHTYDGIFNAEEAIQSLLKEARMNEVSESCLDEEVHDTFSCMASKINNGGFEEQIRFLITHHGPNEVACIRNLFKE